MRGNKTYSHNIPKMHEVATKLPGTSDDSQFVAGTFVLFGAQAIFFLLQATFC